jgi:hypothetical protein
MLAAVFFRVSFSVFITFERVVNVSLWSFTCVWSCKYCMFWSWLWSRDDWTLLVLGLDAVPPEDAPEGAALADSVKLPVAVTVRALLVSRAAPTCSEKGLDGGDTREGMVVLEGTWTGVTTAD